MREVITLILKARFHASQIQLMWNEFWAQRESKPEKDLFVLSPYYDYRGQQDREIWAKVDGEVATLLLPEDY